MQVSTTLSRPRENDHVPPFLFYQFFGGPIKAVYKEEITKPGQLIEYIIKTDRSQTVKVPIVMLFQDDIIDMKHENLNPELTSKENPIKICCKHIKNDNFSLYSFFDHRDINPDTEILSQRRFAFAIEKLQDKAFSPSEGDVMFIQKSAVARRNRKDGGPITGLVGDVLTACLTKTDLQTTFIQEQYSFLDKDKHEAIANHVIFKTTTNRPIIICEDRSNMIHEAILQNFDQLRTFSESEDGREFDMIYGITSNFNEWVFCCYLCPEEGKDVTEDNFLISNTYSINYGPSGLEPTSESIINIIQKIRGFLRPDIDKIFLER